MIETIPNNSLLDEILEHSAALHRHLCPRQVLGARMGILAGRLHSLELPQKNKRLYTFVETDGCFADGIGAATGCWLGRRTMLHLQETFSDVVKTDKTGLSKTAHTRWMISAFANFLPGSTIFRLA